MRPSKSLKRRFSAFSLVLAQILAVGIFFPDAAYANPTVTLPTTIQATTSFANVNSAGALAISGYSAGVSVQVTIGVDHGFVKIGTTSGLTAPTGYTTAQWTADNSTEIAFYGTQANVSAALNSLQYKTAIADGSGTISVTSFVSGAAFNSSTGHFYEIVDNVTAINWEDARCKAKWGASSSFTGTVITGQRTAGVTNYTSYTNDRCSNATSRRTMGGLRGYLANITSLEEQQFLLGKLTGTGWIGGSDIDNEGTYIWMDGPETGQVFWTPALSTSGSRRGSFTVSGSVAGYSYGTNRFNYFSDGEPNDASGEHWVEFGFGSAGIGGSWNDCRNACGSRTKYVIEYGEDSDVLSGASGNISVNPRVVPTASETDTALNLSGNQFLSAINESTFDLSTGTTFTIEAWVRPSISNATQILVGKNQQYSLYINSNGSFGMNFFTATTSNGGDSSIFGAGSVRTGTWQHVSVVRSGTTVTGYINGQATGTLTNASATDPIKSGDNAFVIGGYSASDQPFTGQIDQVRVWSSARTASDLQTDMHRYLPASETNLIASFGFNEVTGTRLFNNAISSNWRSDLKINSGSVTIREVIETSTAGAYTTVTFTRSYLTSSGGWRVPSGVSRVSALIAGGGGGGGDSVSDATGGGGGAGGFFQSGNISISGVVSVGVGAGGLGSTLTTQGGDGQTSYLGTLKVGGGGGGNGYSYAGGLRARAGVGGADFVSSGGGGGGRPTRSGTGNENLGGLAGAYAASGIAFLGTTYIGLQGSAGNANGDGASGGMGGVIATSSLRTSSFSGTSVTYSKISGYRPWEDPLSGAGSKTPGSGGSPNYGYGTDPTVGGGAGADGIIIIRWITASAPIFTAPAAVDTTTALTRYTFRAGGTAVSPLIRNYQWQYSSDTGTSWSTVQASTSDSYTTGLLDLSTSGPRYRYRVIVTDSDTAGLSITDSSTAYLVLNRYPTISPPTSNDTGLLVHLDASQPASYSGSGTTWNDISGGNRNASLGIASGGPAVAGTSPATCSVPSHTQLAGGVFNFSGNGPTSRDCAWISGSSFSNVGETYTVEMWVNPSVANQAQYSALISTPWISGDKINFTIAFSGTQTSGSPNIYGGVFDGTNWFETPVTPIPVSSWSHLTLVSANRILTLYVNGESRTEKTLSSAPSGAGKGVFIGRRWDVNDTFNGLIGTVRISNQALSASQIRQNYYLSSNRFSNSASGVKSSTTTYATTLTETFTATNGTGTKRFTFTPNNRAGIAWDTSTANSAVLRVTSELNVGTYYETMTATDSATASTTLALTITINKARQASLSIGQYNAFPGVSTYPINVYGGSGNGAVVRSLTDSGTASCSLASSMFLSAVRPGTCTVRAVKDGGINYLTETATATIYWIQWSDAYATRAASTPTEIVLNHQTAITKYNYDTLTVTSYQNSSGVTITSIATGATLRIIGDGFDPSAAYTEVVFANNSDAVDLNPSLQVISSGGSNYLQLTIPSGATSGVITVNSPKGTARGPSLTITP